MNEQRTKRILKLAGISFVIAFCLVPFLWMVIISLSERPDFLLYKNLRLTFANFADILSMNNLHFLDNLRNSFVISSSTALVSTLIGALSAYAIWRIPFRGKTLLVLTVLALSMFPQICIVGYLFKIMTKVNLINTYGALILPYIAWSLPLALWMQMSYFSRIPMELDKAAQVDGASRIQTLFRIILPIAAPGFLSTILLLFMFSFNEFMFALMLTSDHNTRTVPVGISMFQGLHGELPWGYIMAASVISCIPVILIALIFQKRIMQGITQGAVKQ